jgi:carboxyl-terminal processing protease
MALLRKNVFYLYTLNYLNANANSIQNEYHNDLLKFKKDFSISDQELNSFLEFAKSKEVTIEKTDLEKDGAYIRARLKAQIARNFWKNEGWFSILLEDDKQMMKAVELFGKARELVNAK